MTCYRTHDPRFACHVGCFGPEYSRYDGRNAVVVIVQPRYNAQLLPQGVHWLAQVIEPTVGECRGFSTQERANEWARRQAFHL